MKKVYASLAAVAMAAIVTASAAIPEIADLSRNVAIKGLNPVLNAPSQKAISTFNSLASVENYNGPKKAAAKLTAADITGTYVNLTVSAFNKYSDNVANENIKVTEKDGKIIFNKFLTFDNISVEGLQVVNATGGIVGTLEDNKIVFPLGQVVGTATITGAGTFDIYLCTYTINGDNAYVSTDGDLTYTIDENGNMTADKSCALFGGEVFGFWMGYDASKLVIPNGQFTADMGTGEAETTAVYVEKQLIGGYETLFVSSVMGPKGGGDYGVFFDLDEEEPTAAIAIEQVVMDASSDLESSGYDDYKLMAAKLTDGKVSLSESLEATLSNNGNTLTFNSTWSVIALNAATSRLSWFGEYQPAVITYSLDGAGVEDNLITVDNSNAPVEYYNLQGIRVNNPAAGSVVIRRQGTEVSKILVK